MELIDKERVIKEVKKVYDEGYKFLPSDINESVEDFKYDLLRVLDTLETKEVEDDFIEKACKWLKFNYTEYLNDTRIGIDIDEMVKDFKMDMKGE